MDDFFHDQLVQHQRAGGLVGSTLTKGVMRPLLPGDV